MSLCLALATLGACGASHARDAEAVFAEFQAALLRGDAMAVRRLLARNSVEVADHLPYERIRTQAPVQVLGVRLNDGEIHVHVADPNQGGRRTRFVLVREDGALRVDLVATTAYNVDERHVPGAQPRFVPVPVDPREVERAVRARPELVRPTPSRT